MNVKDFKIGWFAIILGSGGVALASLPFFPALTKLLAYILTAVFVILTALWILKIVMHPDVVAREMQHFVVGNFYPLQPISAVILALLYHRLSFPFAEPLLIYGAVLILVMTIYISYHFFATTTSELHQIHGGWFIPPVSTILVTYALLLLYPSSVMAFVLSLIYFGIGFMLFLFIATILFLRLVSHELPVAELAPTNFILLAPVGILIVDFMGIAKHASTLLPNASALNASISLWGFGMWALFVNILLLLKYLRQEYSFFLGWWSYVFPTAAFTMGTMVLSQSIEAFRYATMALYALLMLFWVVVTLNTIRMLVR